MIGIVVQLSLAYIVTK